VPYAAINGASIYYQRHGSGPPTVFLHGAGGNHLVWWQQLDPFGKHFQCVTYDARGWGLSRGQMRVGRFAFGTDLVALLDHLGLERANIVAHSMGGRAVAGLLRLAPHRLDALVLSGSNGGCANDRIRELQDQLRETRGPGGLREHALSEGFEAQQPALAALYRQVNAMNPPRPRGMLGRPPATYRGSMHEAISASGARVLFVVGEHDAITSPELIEEAHGLVPGSRMAVIEGAGHSAYFENAMAWNAAVLGHLLEE
jgi:pimeloyl-ACP methyl ester carboxylesterase